MRKIALHLDYNGTPFYGFQRVPAGPSIQSTVEDALQQLTGEKIHVFGAGRTDRGVHAQGQMVHFNVENDYDIVRFMDGLNYYLRPHIAVTKAEEVPEDFHARFSAVARQYRYTLVNRRQMLPLWENRAGLVRAPLNIQAMQQAAALFPLGEADWSSFRSSECQSKTPMVNLINIDISQPEEPFVLLDIEANHFLHHMVRNIVGTLVDVGLGEIQPEDIPPIFDAKDRKKARQTFMPDGLSLMGITYKPYQVLDCCP